MIPDNELLDEEFFEELEKKLPREIVIDIQSQCAELHAFCDVLGNNLLPLVLKST